MIIYSVLIKSPAYNLSNNLEEEEVSIWEEIEADNNAEAMLIGLSYALKFLRDNNADKSQYDVEIQKEEGGLVEYLYDDGRE